MTRVFDRTTSEGIDIHAFVQDQSANQEAFAVGPQVGCVTAGSAIVGVTTATSVDGTNVPACPASTWTPPPECYSTSFVAEAANAGAVGQSWSQAYPLHDVAAVTSG